ncbi:hypothetical protein L0Y59_00945 [Candidatus Uhrbacteria bacterium]|nr:hypothetical protein [Candidatus Uhrbacteria bacterium]
MKRTHPGEGFHPAVIGLFQALGLSAYVGLVATLMDSLGRWIPTPNPTVSIATVLLVLVVSALACAAIAFTAPALLVRDGKLTAALAAVGWTVGWLIAILLTILMTVFVV